MAEFRAAEWKALIKEHLTPIIAKELQLRQIADTVWADDYHMGSRKVLSFFYINDAYATFQWGRNFECVPKCPGNRVTWARTDKSIYAHLYEVSEDFIKVQREARERIIMSRFYHEQNREDAWLQMIDHHKQAFNILRPTMEAFYEATETLEDCLNRIEQQINHGYYNFINGSHLFLSKVFIEYRLGLKEQALSDFSAMYFSEKSLDLKEQFYKKLMSLEKISNKDV